MNLAFRLLSLSLSFHYLFSNHFSAPQLSIALNPSDTIFTLGTTVTLTCSVSLIDSLYATVTAFTWYKGNTIIANDHDVTSTFDQVESTLPLGNILSDKAGNYTCVAHISIDDESIITISNSTNITVQCKLLVYTSSIPVHTYIIFS